MTAAGEGHDRWVHGDRYERYVGRWSRSVAVAFLAWLDAPAGLAWLDVGCGTGALTETVADRCTPRRLVGIDTSVVFLEVARQRLAARGVEFQTADARSLPFPDATFDRIVSGLALNFVPDPAQALAEMARVSRPGGEVALYVWDYVGRMDMMRRFWDAAIELDPRGAEMDESRRFPICRPPALRHLIATTAGLGDARTLTIDVPTVFRDFDDYWDPFLAGQGPAPAYCVALPKALQDSIRDRLRATLPVRPDGSIPLIARAFAVCGRRLS